MPGQPKAQSGPDTPESDEARASQATSNCPDAPLSENLKKIVDEGQPLRRLINALIEEVEQDAEAPPEATKKCLEDLKEVEKEYQGLAEIVKKYDESYLKLDAQEEESKKVLQAITEWTDAKVNSAVKAKIDALCQNEYQNKERTLRCRWIGYRDTFYAQQDCLSQCERKIEDIKEDYENAKNYDKTVKDRFTDLKSLYDKAKTSQEGKKYKSVYAVEVEYHRVLDTLYALETWTQRRADCSAAAVSQRSAGSPSAPRLTPDQLRQRLVDRLRDLILGKYQRFCRHRDRLKAESDAKKAKETLEKLQKSRREDLILEAEDVTGETATQATAAGAPG